MCCGDRLVDLICSQLTDGCCAMYCLPVRCAGVVRRVLQQRRGIRPAWPSRFDLCTGSMGRHSARATALDGLLCDVCCRPARQTCSATGWHASHCASLKQVVCCNEDATAVCCRYVCYNGSVRTGSASLGAQSVACGEPAQMA